MKLGIGTYTYMWSIGFDGAVPSSPMTAMGLLEQAHDFGLHVVQYGPNLPLDGITPGELTALLAGASEWDIEIEVGTKGLDCAHLRNQIEFAKRVGSRFLRTVPDYDRSAPSPSEQELVALFKSLEPVCASAGIRLGIENATIPATILRSALDTVDSTWIG